MMTSYCLVRDFHIALLLFDLQVAEEEYLTTELRKIEGRKKEREKKAQDLQKLIKAADTNTELRRAEKRVSKKKLPQKRETEKPVCSTHITTRRPCSTIRGHYHKWDHKLCSYLSYHIYIINKVSMSNSFFGAKTFYVM